MSRMMMKNIVALTALVCSAWSMTTLHAQTAASGENKFEDRIKEIPYDLPLVRGKSASATRGDFEAELNRVPPEKRLEQRTSEERINGLLERIFINRTLAEAARAESFDRDPGVMAQVRYAAERELSTLYFEALKKKVKVPDLEARAHDMYRANPKEYFAPEQVRVSHILLGFKQKGYEKARQMAEQVRAKAIANPGEKSFDDLALEYSDDQSAARNKGDIGFFTRDKMVSSFSDAAFAMTKQGEISALVESPFGFHILQFRGRQPARQFTFEEVKANLLDAATRDYLEAQVKLIVNDLIAKQEPVPNPEAVEKLRVKVDYGVPPKGAAPAAGPKPDSGSPEKKQ
jgi:peptidyl-prolyl cis-trans isomerase C